MHLWERKNETVPPFRSVLTKCTSWLTPCFAWLLWATFMINHCCRHDLPLYSCSYYGNLINKGIVTMWQVKCAKKKKQWQNLTNHQIITLNLPCPKSSLRTCVAMYLNYIIMWHVLSTWRKHTHIESVAYEWCSLHFWYKLCFKRICY